MHKKLLIRQLFQYPSLVIVLLMYNVQQNMAKYVITKTKYDYKERI